MKHCGTQELTTERLVLRRMTTDDCEMMFGNWANDPEVTRYLRWEPHRDWVVTMAYLNEIVKQYDRPDFYDWGICDKVTGVLMGNISIAPAESCEREKPYAWKNVKTELLGGMYEIGYSLGKKWWTRCGSCNMQILYPSKNRGVENPTVSTQNTMKRFRTPTSRNPVTERQKSK